MKLPADIFIAREKLTDYLLVWQKRGDKSGFLGGAGYSVETAARLEADLRQLAAEADTKLSKSNPHGDYYETRGILQGPNRVCLRVKAIWMSERLSGRTKFITLIPD